MAEPSSVGRAIYRVWIRTDHDDSGGRKGDVSICLHGILGSAWLAKLDECQSTSGRKLFEKSATWGSRGCELHVAADEVGTLQRITVAYAHGDGDGGCTPWKLSRVVVRHGTSSNVVAFAANATLKGPRELLALAPHHSWYEDIYGNCTEAPPAVPSSGQWHWPTPLQPSALACVTDDGQRAAQHEATRLATYRALCEEEIIPLIDEVLHDLAMTRTPGTFLHACVEATTGWQPVRPPTGAAKAKPSAEGASEMDRAYEQIRILGAENVALENRLRAMPRWDSMRAGSSLMEESSRPREQSRSTMCVLL